MGVAKLAGATTLIGVGVLAPDASSVFGLRACFLLFLFDLTPAATAVIVMRNKTMNCWNRSFMLLGCNEFVDRLSWINR